MPFAIESKLVIAVASSALFDLTEADRVFRTGGIDAYRRHQHEHEGDILKPGCAFPFIRRLLTLNGAAPDDQPVEVVLLSRNDADTGLRVFNSIEHYGLGISRAAFTRGRSPHSYIPAFNASLFLSGDPADVACAIAQGQPAGTVIHSPFLDDPHDTELRVGFDFDGVLVDDEAQQVYDREGIDQFLASEDRKAASVLNPGPLKRLLQELAGIQRLEQHRKSLDGAYQPKLRTAIITARNAPSHKRVVTTLRSWGLNVDEAFFLGGMDKRRIFEVFRPHIFFDDTRGTVESAAGQIPAVHIPFGVQNRPSPAGGLRDAGTPYTPA